TWPTQKTRNCLSYLRNGKTSHKTTRAFLFTGKSYQLQRHSTTSHGTCFVDFCRDFSLFIPPRRKKWGRQVFRRFKLISYPRPPQRGAIVYASLLTLEQYGFLSTPPREGRRPAQPGGHDHHHISNHALRKGRTTPLSVPPPGNR